MVWSASWRLQRRVASRWTHAHKHTHTVRWPHFDCWKLTLGLTVVETMQCALQFRDSLIQSQHSLKAKPRPLLLPHENLELSGAESIMGAPEATACQVAERGRKCLSFLMFSLLLSSFLLHLSLLFSLHPSPFSVHPFMFLFLCRVFSPPSLSSATPAAPGLIGLSRKSLPTAVMWQHCVASCRMPVSVTTWPLFL